MERYQRKGVRLLFRADAAFAKPEVYEYLEPRGIGYAIRVPANDVLQEQIGHLLKRPVGRPPKKPIVRYHDFMYRAKSWDQPRRVVAKVEWHRGELFPRAGFIVTNLTLPEEGVVHFYNGRGTAEQVDQRGEVCLALDAALLPPLRGQRGAPPAICTGLQLGEFPAATGPAAERAGLVATKPTGEAHQDRCPDGAPCPAHHLSDGRGGGA